MVLPSCSQLAAESPMGHPWSLSALAVGWAAKWGDSSMHGALAWLVPSKQAVVAANSLCWEQGLLLLSEWVSTLLFFPLTKNAWRTKLPVLFCVYFSLQIFLFELCTLWVCFLAWLHMGSLWRNGLSHLMPQACASFFASAHPICVSGSGSFERFLWRRTQALKVSVAGHHNLRLGASATCLLCPFLSYKSPVSCVHAPSEHLWL